MLGSRWIVAALVLVCPLLAFAEPVRLLILSAESGGIDPVASATVRRHLVEAAARLPEFELVEPPDRTCDTSERGCLLGLAVAAGADEVILATPRLVGEARALLLVHASTRSERLQRHTDPLPSGDSMGPALRERLIRLLLPSRWVGALAVDALPGSEIWVDGERMGVAPLAEPLRNLAPGQHTLRVVRPGVGEARANVEVQFERVTHVRIEPRSDQLAILGIEPEGVAVAEAPARGRGGWPALRWGLAGAGGVALLGAAWPALEAADLRDEREALRDADGAFPAEARRRQRALRDSYERRRVLSNVLLGTGAALLVGAGALFVFDPAGDAAEGVQLHAGPGGLAVSGQF